MHVNGVDDLILYVASSPDEVRTDRIASCRAVHYFYKPLILRGKSLNRKERFRYTFFLVSTLFHALIQIYTPLLFLQSRWCMHAIEIVSHMLREQVRLPRFV